MGKYPLRTILVMTRAIASTESTLMQSIIAQTSREIHYSSIINTASRNTYVIDTLLHGCDFFVTPLEDVVLVAYTISTAATAATPPSVPPSVPTLAFSARNARASTTTTTRFPSLLLSFSFSFFLSFLFVF